MEEIFEAISRYRVTGNPMDFGAIRNAIHAYETKSNATLREQIARDVKGLVRREYEQVGRDYMTNWQMVKRDDGDYVLFDDVIAAIDRGK